MKRKLLNAYKKTKNVTLKNQINSLQKQIKNDIIEEENRNWEEKIKKVNTMNANPAKSWKEIKKQHLPN
jgi:uncharacterized protein YqgV (UPF0045/DUF77 family)